jgi:hypothetical protein
LRSQINEAEERKILKFRTSREWLKVFSVINSRGVFIFNCHRLTTMTADEEGMFLQ